MYSSIIFNVKSQKSREDVALACRCRLRLLTQAEESWV